MQRHEPTVTAHQIADQSDRTNTCSSAWHCLQVNIVVNNAAVMSHNWADKDFSQACATNFVGPVRVAEKLAPLMQPGAVASQKWHGQHESSMMQG